MSLRVRLIATLLLLAAAGMLVLGAITYATQKSFQQDRIDEQTLAAGPAMDRVLDDAGIYPPGIPAGVGPRGNFEGDHRGPPHGDGDPAGQLPPGTYGERRDSGGKVLGSRVICCTTPALPRPRLPQRLAAGEVVTVDAVRGETSYRARAFANPGGHGVTVVAMPLNGVRATLDRLLRVEALVIAGVLLLLGALGSVLVRLGLRPLDRIGQTAGAIAAGDLSRRVDVTSERTEVGRLGLALNGMLGRLERAFAEREASESRLRQFLSDASHELRTPLASIRGYAELFRIGAARSDEDVTKAMRRIEDEAQRMGVLVEDLLTLARLDETRET